VSYDVRDAHERGVKRSAEFAARINSRYSTYDFEQQDVAADRDQTQYLHQTLEFKPHIDSPRLQPGMYFLCVPYVKAAVYPSLQDEDSWHVQRPFIMGLDYAELERLRWVQHDVNSGFLDDYYSVSGTIRGTRAKAVEVRHVGVGIDIDMRTDYEARSVQLFTRHAPGDTTFVDYDGLAHPTVMPFIWEERVPIAYDVWMSNATRAERIEHERDTRATSQAPAPGRQRVVPPRYYASVPWELLLLGTDEDLMQDDKFWARHIAFIANGEPAIVETVPPQAEVHNRTLKLTSKQQYQAISRFITMYRERAAHMRQQSAMDTSE
jgi:hypothetical protein